MNSVGWYFLTQLNCPLLHQQNDCCLLAGLEFLWAKCGPQRRWSCPHPHCEWIWMKYEIWWESESSIKARQPVTYGNVFLHVSDCPGFSFQLLYYWWLSVPDLSGWSQMDMHTVSTHSYAQSNNTFITYLPWNFFSFGL